MVNRLSKSNKRGTRKGPRKSKQVGVFLPQGWKIVEHSTGPLIPEHYAGFVVGVIFDKPYKKTKNFHLKKCGVNKIRKNRILFGEMGRAITANNNPNDPETKAFHGYFFTPIKKVLSNGTVIKYGGTGIIYREDIGMVYRIVPVGYTGPKPIHERLPYGEGY